MAAASTSSGRSCRRLWIHLDVNKTLIAIDPASGQDLQTALNGAVAAAAWGKLTSASGCHVRPWVDPSDVIAMPDGSTRPDTHGYGFDFLPPSSGGFGVGVPEGYDPASTIQLARFIDEHLFPYINEQGCEARGLKPTDVRAANHAVKLARRRCLDRVLSSEGSEALRLYGGKMEAMIKAMAVPSEKQAAFAPLSADGTGMVRFMIPAFFKLLDWVATERPDSAIVFRTFGSDLPEVIREHNAYCCGKHPLYKGEASERLQVITPQATGRVLRFADSKHGVALATVVLDEDGGAGPATFVRGVEEIHHDLAHRRSRGLCCLAIQDDYSWWKAHDEDDDHGKILLVRDDDQGLSEELSIFFDDNVNPHRAKIVDARDYHTGKAVPFSRSTNLYLRTANVAVALEDEDFFIKGVLDSEARAEAILARKTE